MFERFTKPARETVVGAQEVSARLGHAHIGSEHLLAALAEHPGAAADALAARGLTAGTVTQRLSELARTGDLDADALGDLGIDLDAVRDRVESHFGPGALDRPRRRKKHLPFTAEAKKVIELSLREAIRLGDREITERHLLLAILRSDSGAAHRIVVEAGIDPAALRAELEGGDAAQSA